MDVLFAMLRNIQKTIFHVLLLCNNSHFLSHCCMSMGWQNLLIYEKVQLNSHWRLPSNNNMIIPHKTANEETHGIIQNHKVHLFSHLFSVVFVSFFSFFLCDISLYLFFSYLEKRKGKWLITKKVDQMLSV